MAAAETARLASAQTAGDAGRMAVSGRVPVLFIAGPARSGSTLLDRAIGTRPGFCSMGELQFIWQRSFGENQLCGCGRPFRECAFWGEVSQRAFGVKPVELDVEHASRLKAAVDTKRRLPWLLVGGPASARAALRAYGELIERLYRSILEVSGASVIVDSSKDPRHGLVLARLPFVELHVVHLVRDPRAVAFSWGRTRRRPEIHWKAQDMTTQTVRASAARWTTHNTVAELLCASADSHCRVRYEDSGATLERVLAPYGQMPGAQPAHNGLAQLMLEPSHSVAGNPMRFKHGKLAVKLDDEWRRAMPLHDRLWVSALTWPLLRRYGYHVHSGA
jgi:Sulfotransferase family